MPHKPILTQDTFEIVDFLDETLAFLPEHDRKPYLKAVEDVEAGKRVPLERLNELAKNCGAATWAARRALKQFIDTVGSEFEWEAVLKAVRPTTAVLLKRLWKNTGLNTLDEVLANPDAALAIHDSEETELELLRPEIRLQIWRDHAEKLKPLVKEAQIELEAMRKRLKRMRDVASTSTEQTDLILAKLQQFEDRIYLEGEAIPLEILDKEVQFQTADREIPPTDDALPGAETLPVRFEVEEPEIKEEAAAEEV